MQDRSPEAAGDASQVQLTLLCDLDALGLIINERGVVESSPLPFLVSATLARIQAPQAHAPALPVGDGLSREFAQLSEQIPVTLTFNLAPAASASAAATAAGTDAAASVDGDVRSWFRIMGDDAALAGKFDAAVEEYSIALRAAPEGFFARANRCVANTLLNRMDAARADARVLLDCAPKVPLSYVLASRTARDVAEAGFWLCQGVDLLAEHGGPLLLRLARFLQSLGDEHATCTLAEHPGKTFVCVAKAAALSKVPGVKLVSGRATLGELELHAVNGREGADWTSMPGVLVAHFAPAPRSPTLMPGVRDVVVVAGAGLAAANGVYVPQAMRNEALSFENEHGLLLSREAGEDGRCAWVIGDPVHAKLVYVLDPAAHPGRGHWLCLDTTAHAPAPSQVTLMESVVPSLQAIQGGARSADTGANDAPPAGFRAPHVLLAVKGYGLRLAQEGFYAEAAPCLQSVADQALALAVAEDVKGLGPMALDARLARLVCLIETGADADGVAAEAEALCKVYPLAKRLLRHMGVAKAGKVRRPTLHLANGVAVSKPGRRKSSPRVMKQLGDDVVVVLQSPPSTAFCMPPRNVRFARGATVTAGPGERALTIVGTDGAAHVLECESAAVRDDVLVEFAAWAAASPSPM